jgi:hypothetical protein
MADTDIRVTISKCVCPEGRRHEANAKNEYVISGSAAYCVTHTGMRTYHGKCWFTLTGKAKAALVDAITIEYPDLMQFMTEKKISVLRGIGRGKQIITPELYQEINRLIELKNGVRDEEKINCG